ncbi:Glycosyltransferase involved in cell wall bisynthesis [Alicyclobacillus tolerans]|uniref:Glycosyltransferase involved in cell wall bisynthesis n=2 Tax=Alicyclobacillus tolerans TaxID=90970 RepID=A0A1M6M4E7_9BACL|nr:Glycosyltransferase involved in cell wall bisynthesis [Alicyclobacillus montanus]
MEPLVSVLMPIYNGEKYLYQSIQSVLNQSYENFELILMDDGSNDLSVEVIKHFQDQRIRFYSSSINRGLFPAHNWLIKQSRGEFIKFLHQDDILPPDSLLEYVKLLESNEKLAFVAAVAEFIDAEGKKISEFPWAFAKDKIWPEKTLYSLSWQLGNLIGNPPSVMFRKSSFIEDSPFDERFKNSSDWKLLLKLASTSPSISTSKKLVQYRIHVQSQSSLNYRQAITVREDMQIIKETKSDNLPFKQMISSFWRQHLQIIYSVFQLMQNSQILRAIELLEFILREDPYLSSYEQGACLQDIKNWIEVLSSMSDKENQWQVLLLSKTKSVLYSWFMQRGLGISYEFFDKLIHISFSKPLKLFLIGYDAGAFGLLEFLKAKLNIQIVGVWDFLHHLSNEQSFPVFSEFRLVPADAYVIVTDNRLQDFLLYQQITEMFEANAIATPVIRFREWIL